ncbi:MAG: S1 RNA-binding domain-containing protein [Ruminococcus sp.]|jgi:S1 RNA binding domain protein|nr:S1 RNA-binding domain-containing protein [Ruminococcus sp.]
MQLEVGKIYEGKVTGITKFGAFVEIEKGTTGMVHISEIANTYVNEITDHIQEGQTVKVKVLSLGDNGKIGLSIKKALPESERKPFNRNGDRPDRRPGQGGRNGGRNDGQRRSFQRTERPEPQDFAKNPPPVYEQTTSGNADFEDMMAKFKATSEERFSDLKHVMENKRRGSSRRR